MKNEKFTYRFFGEQYSIVNRTAPHIFIRLPANITFLEVCAYGKNDREKRRDSGTSAGHEREAGKYREHGDTAVKQYIPSLLPALYQILDFPLYVKGLGFTKRSDTSIPPLISLTAFNPEVLTS